jgi:alcohol dehydrogenase class IV
LEITFNAPSSILFGAGARFRLPDELRRLKISRTLLVTDARLQSAGVIAEFESRLNSNGIAATAFTEVQPDPTDLNVAEGLECLRNCEAEAIVAIGGGSVIDAAKIIGVAAANPQPLSAFQGYNKIANAGLPLLAVPTTAGTGSEATKAAVITDTSRQVKMLILDGKIMPQISIVDYELSLSMPRQLTAYVGVDTLVHGMEAFVSRRANTMTDPLALSSIQLTSRHLETAYHEPDNRVSREAMALAACQGGMAFTNSSVCLVHGMSRPLGAVFHLAHGLSNAVLLPSVTRFSIPGAAARYAQIARVMGLCAVNESEDRACGRLVDELERLNAQLGIPKLRDCVKATESEWESHLGKMAEDALASGSPQNNPVVPTAREIIDLYRSIW